MHSFSANAESNGYFIHNLWSLFGSQIGGVEFDYALEFEVAEGDDADSAVSDVVEDELDDACVGIENVGSALADLREKIISLAVYQ